LSTWTPDISGESSLTPDDTLRVSEVFSFPTPTTLYNLDDLMFEYQNAKVTMNGIPFNAELNAAARVRVRDRIN